MAGLQHKPAARYVSEQRSGELNGGGEKFNRQRPDQMDAVIQGIITLVHAQSKAFNENVTGRLRVIRESRAEIQDLLLFQREQRIDIMPRFESGKQLKAKLDTGNP